MFHGQIAVRGIVHHGNLLPASVLRIKCGILYLALIIGRFPLRIKRHRIHQVHDRKLRMAGAQARPDLCQDPRPIAVAIMIADIAGQRRNKSGPQIILASAIFRTVRVDKGQPIFPQQLAVDVPAVFLDRVEPYKLQIQIVVRKRLVQRLRIILNVEQTAHTLKRRA